MSFVSKYFSEAEMRCKCGCGRADMSPGFMFKLDSLRERYGKPLIVTSGFRCAEHNLKVSETGSAGPHTTGRAVDFAVGGPDAIRLLSLALAGGFNGFGINQKGASRFIHLDDLTNEMLFPRPSIWSY